jgi:hypothetical protein
LTTAFADASVGVVSNEAPYEREDVSDDQVMIALASLGGAIAAVGMIAGLQLLARPLVCCGSKLFFSGEFESPKAANQPADLHCHNRTVIAFATGTFVILVGAVIALYVAFDRANELETRTIVLGGASAGTPAPVTWQLELDLIGAADVQCTNAGPATTIVWSTDDSVFNNAARVSIAAALSSLPTPNTCKFTVVCAGCQFPAGDHSFNLNFKHRFSQAARLAISAPRGIPGESSTAYSTLVNGPVIAPPGNDLLAYINKADISMTPVKFVDKHGAASFGFQTSAPSTDAGGDLGMIGVSPTYAFVKFTVSNDQLLIERTLIQTTVEFILSTLGSLVGAVGLMATVLATTFAIAKLTGCGDAAPDNGSAGADMNEFSSQADLAATNIEMQQQ